MENDITLQVGVKIILKNKAGECLLVRRSLVKYPETKGGRWDIVGGRIHPGTPLLENLKREIKEETGLALAGEPKLLAAQDILRVAGRHVVRLTYAGKAEGEVVLDAEEHDSYQWYSLAALRTLDEIDKYFKALLDDAALLREIEQA